MLVLSSFSQQIKIFDIECDPGDFQFMYENYTEEIYIPVQITHDGITWQDVRLRIRGDSSKEYPKKSLKAFFDGEPFISGEVELNFNADYQDRSYMHSYLSSVVFNSAGIECTAIEHVILFLNGEFFGIYLLTQNVDASFLQSHGYTGNGNLYKAAFDGACLSVFDNIFYHWEKKQDGSEDRSDLAELIRNLNNCPDNEFYDFLGNTFEYNRLISVLGLNMLVANGSTYYHNYFLYHETGSQGKWCIFPWDLDRTFSSYSKWYPFHRSSGFWTPDNPLLERSLIDDQVFSDIKTRLAELSEELFNPDILFPVIDSIKALLLPYIPLDTTDQVENVAMWEEYVVSNRDFISDRYNELNYQMSHYPGNFRLNRHGEYHSPDEVINFSWSGSSDPGGLPVQYILYVSMDQDFEDSTTQIIEGINTKQYAFGPLTKEGKYYWMVEATNGSLTIEGFDNYNPVFVSKGIPPLVINEINYNSSSASNSEDWVEIFNPLDSAVSVSGWYFKDDDDSHKFTFPSGIVLGPQGYLVLCRDTAQFFEIFSDTINVAGNMDFGFRSEGELLRLYHPMGYLVDSLVYDSEFPWPATPNGNGPTLELINPSMNNALASSWDASAGTGTPGRRNSVYSPISISEKRIEPFDATLYPNPFLNSPEVFIDVREQCNLQLEIFDLKGRKVAGEFVRGMTPGLTRIKLDCEDLQAGVYNLLIIKDGFSSKAYKIIKTGP